MHLVSGKEECIYQLQIADFQSRGFTAGEQQLLVR